MNKELEALNDIRKVLEEAYKFPLNLTPQYKFIYEALKRNEPMRPKVAWKNEDDEDVVGYRCLNCNGSLGAKLDDKPMFPNFCRHCGQKLDWSE